MPGINLENERCWREGRTRRGAEVEAGRTRTEQDVRKPTITGAGKGERVDSPYDLTTVNCGVKGG
jgi:hypothetical protein